MTNEELILLKSEMDNLKSTVSEMKKEIKKKKKKKKERELLY